MNTDAWFVADTGTGETAGPMIGDELAQRVTEGKVKPDDLVWCDGMTAWQRASLFMWLLGDVVARS